MNEKEIEKTVLERMDVTIRGFAYHVDGCPIQKRIWNGIPYANVIEDCWNGMFRENHNLDGHDGNGLYVMCSGRPIWFKE